MSKQSQDALAAIDRIVFQSSRPVVVALTGGWGEGKTYFWKEEVVPSHKDAKPGYVSVFGAESLAMIRERVAIASIGLSEFGTADSGQKWTRAVKSVFSGMRKAWNSLGEKIGVSDSIAVEFFQTFSLKAGWIICIDDVERLSEKVGFDNFLGYVTELRDQRQLKVVLIYNKEPIDKDEKSSFHVYQEKVIDRSIPFALDFDDVVKLVFKDVQIPTFDVCGEVLKKSEVLGLRNIRILVKARSYFEEVSQLLGAGAERDFLRAALTSLLLYSYTKFSNQKPAKLTFEMLTKHSEWTDRFRKSAGMAVAEDEQKPEPAKELLEQYQYMTTDQLDLLLMCFVQTDVLDADKLRTLHTQYKNDENKRQASQHLHEAIDSHYHGSVRDNPGELCDAIEAALPPCLTHLPPGELDFALGVLSTFGRDANARQYFDEFKRVRGQVFEQLDNDSMPMGSYSYDPLKDYFQAIREARDVDQRSIDDVMTSAFADSFIHSRDSARLAEFSVDDFVAYFMAHDQPKLTSKLRALAKDSNNTVRELALGAADKIAATGKLSRMRMAGMGLLRQLKV
jgi:hypothetical protein